MLKISKVNSYINDGGCLIIIFIVLVILLFKLIVFLFKEYPIYSWSSTFVILLFLGMKAWMIHIEEKQIQIIKDTHYRAFKAYIKNSTKTEKKEYPSDFNKEERREILKIKHDEWSKWDNLIESVFALADRYPEELLFFINKNHMYPSWDIKPKVLTDKLLLNLSLTNILKITGIAEEEWIAQRELKVLEKFYPSGVSEYKKVNPNASTIEIVKNANEVKSYQNQIDIASKYDQWEFNQKCFNNEFYNASKKHRPNDGRYVYNIDFQKKDKLGKTREGEFKVWQIFAEAYSCDLIINSKLNWLTQADRIEEFREKNRFYVDSFYKSIYDLIISSKGIYTWNNVLVILNDAPFGLWSRDILIYHYANLRSLFKDYDLYNEAGVCYMSKISEAIKNYEHKNCSPRLIIVDFITSNSRLKKECEMIISQFKDLIPCIGYITFIKEYDKLETTHLLESVNSTQDKKEMCKTGDNKSNTTKGEEHDYLIDSFGPVNDLDVDIENERLMEVQDRLLLIRRYENKGNALKENNQEQQSVIEIQDSRHLVLAPPGCGKTRVLAERVVTAVANQIDATNMLCLTFTNRAAREMRDRISSRAEQEVLDKLFVGNVHHFCSYMLREHKVISQRTTIIDDEESTAILQNIVRQVTGKEKKDVDSYYNYQHYLYQIEHQHPEELIVRSEFGDKLLDFDYKKVAREYVSYKERYGLLDFEDLLLKGYDFIRDQQNEIKKYSWIQIDEVQDLNSLQLAIIDLVATDDACIVYLGDEQQAIYGFNGVKMATLESLKDRCAGNIHHFLGNYRSPQYLLDVLNQYAEVNLHVSRELLPIAKGKDAQNMKEDGSLIVETCDQKEGMDYSDYCSYDMACDRAISYQEGRTAILANSNREVDIISERLYRRGVEHFKISGSDFMWTKEVKLILSHFNIFIHPENIMSWARIFMGFKVLPTLEEAHAFLLEANDSYLYANDLLSDKRRSLIKEFLRYYPDEFVIFDTETTGLDVNNDDIVEIAAIRIKEGCIIDELDIMLETTKSIPVELNGEPNPLIEEYPKREKVRRRSGLTDFMSWVGNVPVLAHNAKFDFQILDANLKRDCNIGDLSSRWPIVLDSLNIARAVEPEQKSYRLKDLLAAFNLAGKNSHLAIDDVKATKSLVDYCYKKASPIFVKQNEFFAENRDVIEMLRKQYSNLYSHTKALLSKKESERNVFVGEIVYVYDCLVNDEIIGKMEKMKYLTEFLERDFLQETSELTLRQILDKYMMELNTLREADLCDSKSLREKVGLFVSTVHRAKGLEFDNVVVTGVVDGIYPFWEATKILKESYIPKEREKAQRDIEESARKLYVALSRSKKRLCIQYPRNNTGFGKFGWFQHLAKPSPFISCISPMFDNIMN